MTKATPPGDDAAFWRLAEPMLERPGVTRSTMMGFSCLRYEGDFFASCDSRTGDLVVKLSEERVEELIAAKKAEVFAPSGRPFREWASVLTRRRRSWAPLIDEAMQLSSERVRTKRGRPRSSRSR